MDIDAAPIFVRLAGQADATLKPVFARLAELYDSKLWHEFSVVAEELFKNGGARNLMLPIYFELIKPLQKRLSPDSFARFTVCAAGCMESAQDAVGLLLDLSSQYSKTSPQTSHLFVYARMSAAFYQLGLGAVDEAKAAIDECGALVEGFTGVDPSIKAAFYKVRSEYDKVKALFSAFYRDSLLYLACINSDELPVAERLQQAHDLCVAALLGETVYNFGELLMHPIIEALRASSEHGYLVAALLAFNSGNHAAFEAVLPAVAANPVLAGRVDFLRQKMCLMSLVECVFAHLKQTRSLPFAVISEACHVPVGEVEFLLIKAISLGIVKGTIDELNQCVTVDWVQARVLDREQMAGLRASIKEWKARIAGISQNLDLLNSIPEVMAE